MDNGVSHQLPINQQGPSSAPAKRTRRRKLLSCYDCRRRKLLCDRAQPACNRCTKAGQAAHCVYLERASDVPVAPAEKPKVCNSSLKKTTAPIEHTGGDAITRLHHQDHRIRELEDALGDSSQMSTITAAGPASIEGPVTPVSVDEDSRQANIRGASFRTQIQGPTYTASILDDKEIQKFNNEIHDHFSAVSRMRKELRDEETETQGWNGRALGRIVTDADLNLLLPSKLETDELVHLYLDHYGKMYHILYMPAFWETYTLLWSDNKNSDPSFVASILAMIAAVSCLVSTSFEGRFRSDAIIESLYLWLVQRSKARSTLSDLQFRVLLAIAKQASGRRFKSNWIELGQVLQLCMVEGLHVEPEKSTALRLTPIEKELRRRIWAAAIELELQASFDRGIGSAVPQFDTRPPTNIHDRDLALLQDLDQASTASHDFTRVTCLATAAQSFQTRLAVNKYLNTPNHPMTFADVKRFTDDLQHHLHAIVDSFKSTNTSTIPESLFILQLSIRQYILTLNNCFIPHAKTKSEGDFSRMIVLQQGNEILHLYVNLARPTCRLALELFHSDRVRAALGVCQVAAQVGSGVKKDRTFATWAKMAVDQAIPVVKASLKEKVTRIGREQRHLWCVLVAEAYLKAKEDPSQRLIYMQRAVEEMAEAYNGMLAARAEAAMNSQLMLQLPAEWTFDDGTFGGQIDLMDAEFLVG